LHRCLGGCRAAPVRRPSLITPARLPPFRRRRPEDLHRIVLQLCLGPPCTRRGVRAARSASMTPHAHQHTHAHQRPRRALRRRYRRDALHQRHPALQRIPCGPLLPAPWLPCRSHPYPSPCPSQCPRRVLRFTCCACLPRTLGPTGAGCRGGGGGQANGASSRDHGEGPRLSARD